MRHNAGLPDLPEISGIPETEASIALEHIVFLALIQGITEFAPVSSTAHLVLVPTLLGATDQGLLVDVAAHAGTFAAVSLYFWNEIWRVLQGVFFLVSGARSNPEARLAAALLVAALPVVPTGLLFWTLGLADALREIEVIAWASIGFGVLLYLADRLGASGKKISGMALPQMLFVGFVQALALIPGASRAGLVVTAGRMLGMNREEAIRFAFLLAIPAVGAASLLGVFELVRTGSTIIWADAALVFLLAFLSSIAAIWVLERFVRRWNFTLFVIYRVALGIGLLWYAG